LSPASFFHAAAAIDSNSQRKSPSPPSFHVQGRLIFWDEEVSNRLINRTCALIYNQINYSKTTAAMSGFFLLSLLLSLLWTASSRFYSPMAIGRMEPATAEEDFWQSPNSGMAMNDIQAGQEMRMAEELNSSGQQKRPILFNNFSSSNRSC
jgi:hypothetical protein